MDMTASSLTYRLAYVIISFHKNSDDSMIVNQSTSFTTTSCHLEDSNFYKTVVYISLSVIGSVLLLSSLIYLMIRCYRYISKLTIFYHVVVVIQYILI